MLYAFQHKTAENELPAAEGHTYRSSVFSIWVDLITVIWSRPPGPAVPLQFLWRLLVVARGRILTASFTRSPLCSGPARLDVVLFGPDANLTPDRRRDSFKLACLLRPVPGPIRSLSLAAGPGPPWSDFLWPFPPAGDRTLAAGAQCRRHERQVGSLLRPLPSGVVAPGAPAPRPRGARRLIPVADLTGRRGIETLARDSDNCLLGWRLRSASIA